MSVPRAVAKVEKELGIKMTTTDGRCYQALYKGKELSFLNMDGDIACISTRSIHAQDDPMRDVFYDTFYDNITQVIRNIK